MRRYFSVAEFSDHPIGSADLVAPPGDLCGDAEAGDVRVRAEHWSQARDTGFERGLACVGRERAGDRMFRVFFEQRGQRGALGFVDVGERADSDDFERSERERARLVEYDVARTREPFEYMSSKDEQADARQAVGCGRQSDRCCERERARAGDHERREGDAERRARSGMPPIRERGPGGDQNGTHEVASDAIGELRDARAVGLSAIEHCDDPRHDGAAADPRDGDF